MHFKSVAIALWLFCVAALTVIGVMAIAPPAAMAAAPASSEQTGAPAEAATELFAMIDSREAYTTDQILPLYDALEPVDIDFMIGTWKGGKFDGGNSPDPINWYGKRFTSTEDVDPLLARKPDGTVYSWDGWGMARLREVKFRGKVSATLIYNQRPIMDYFRKLDDQTVIGFGEPKGFPPFFFYLVRE
ncbi:DUF4334 domain-containing protein [Desulfatitalea alkaliphila]|uniref:DUF4334 domain-containing protein n=1 Tax=Desulfatitalea alkaliphila TaxID=2929485 RepID=A0AA41UIP7_9BACT|nr:DUF4334 domain-containing protein [Desulfatitalea alkaliphila]MCJ8499767.1 DUF4334 domain-containing protein [Desulfatitalea alkaliphila]